MLRKDVSKEEIEKFLASKGDFVKIDYLTKFLKEDLSVDVRKFVCLRLAEIYEQKKILSDAAKMYGAVAIVCVAFSEKIKNYVKETELYIRAGMFDMADGAMRKAMNIGNAVEKNEIYFIVKELYKKQAGIYEKEMRRNHAVRIYEKLLEMNISDSERKGIKEKLLVLYEKLGKMGDYFDLERGV